MAEEDNDYEQPGPSTYVIGVQQQIGHAEHVYRGTPPQSRREDVEHEFRKFKMKINRRTRDRYEESITSDDDFNVLETHEEKYPQILKIRFYKGEYSKVMENDLENPGNQMITLDELLGDDNRFKAIVGPPGSGKTVLANRISMKLLDLDEENCVHVIKVENMEKSDQLINSSHLLFGKFINKNKKEIEDLVEWLHENPQYQKKIYVIFDSLDRSDGWSLKEGGESVNYADHAKCSDIMYSFFHGDIFPSVKIIATSRAHGIQWYRNEVRPNLTVGLAGFNRADTIYLLKRYLDDTEGNMVNQLSETLLSLCSSPMMLVCTAVLHKDYPDASQEKISTIMMGIIQSIRRNPYALENEPFENLKKMSWEKICKNETTFTENDVLSYDLNLANLRSLTITFHKHLRGIRVGQLLRGDSKMSFCHQLIQESLAALRVVEVPVEEFQEIMRELNKPRLSTVRQLVSGLLMNRMTRNMANGMLGGATDSQERIEMMKMNFRQELGKNMIPYNRFMLLSAIHEAGDQVNDVIDLIKELNLHMLPLKQFDVRILSSIVQSCGFLEKLNLYGCNIDTEKLKILWEFVKDFPVKITSLVLAANDIGVEGMEFVADIASHCEVKKLDLHLCNLTDDHVRKLNPQLLKVEKLNFRNNKQLSVDGLELIGGLAKCCKVITLDLSWCNITNGKLARLELYLSEVEELFLTGNINLREEGFRTVGRIVANGKVKRLHLNHLDLGATGLKAFENEVKKAFEAKKTKVGLTHLNVSNNNLKLETLCISLQCILHYCNIECLDLHGCFLNDVEKEKLLYREDGDNIKYDRLDKYKKVSLGTETMRLLLQEEQKYLDISLQDTSQDNLKTLPKLLQDSKARIQNLCFAEGRKASAEDIKVFCKVLDFVTEGLWLTRWEVDEHGENKLREKIEEMRNPNLGIHLPNNVVL